MSVAGQTYCTEFSTIPGMRQSDDPHMLREAAARCRELAALAQDEFEAKRLKQDALALETHAAEIEARGGFR
jgi:hypothetical protein